MKTHKRIAFIVNFVTPYRITFYEKLSLHQEFEWLFIHGIKKKEDGRPAYTGELGFPNQSIGYQEFLIGSFSMRWQAGLLKQLENWKPQSVITLGIPGTLTNWIALYWARMNKAKNIVWHAGWEAQLKNPRSLAIKKWLERRYLRLADHIIVYSSKGATYLETLNVLPEKMTICFNGIETDDLLANEIEINKKAQALRNREKLGGKKVFLYVGGMFADKQVPLLLRAFHNIKDTDKAVLWLVGDGPDLQKIKDLAKTLKIGNVRFWGRVIEGVDIYFAASDYFVLPGVGGLALNQALFWRIPCIVSDADGTEEDLVLDGETGFRFVPEDVDSLTKAILKCMQLSEFQRKKIGNLGRELVLTRSNVNQMVKTFIKVINRLINT